MLLDAVRSKARPGAGVGVAATPLPAPEPSRSTKKQRSIHDFFSQDMTCRSTRKPKKRLETMEDESPVQKRIDYDSYVEDSSEEQPADEPQTTGSAHQKPKKIDFALFSSQRSEPDGEPTDANAQAHMSTPRRFTGLPPSASQSSFAQLATPVRNSQMHGGFSQYSQYSQDELDFLTPRDQPVVHLSNPTTPSPLKKRQRLNSDDGGADLIREEEVQNLTQDMTHVHVRQARHGPPSLCSDAGASPMDTGLLPTPQKSGHNALGVVVSRRTPRPKGNQAVTLLSSESFVNPFAPESASESGKKKRSRRKRRSFPNTWVGSASGQPVSKYLSEFSEQELIGSGSFSKVYKCLKKLDGWVYAVKKSKRHFRGKADTERALREVQALAALSNSQHVVRYFDAWIEDDLLYIQLEHCRGCSLGDFVDKYAPHHIPEATLCKVLCHVAQALYDMHSKKIVHMDVKLQNVLIGPGEIYKLGDLGTASHLDGSMEITEGDNRYLSRELLEGNRTNLRAGDIFALGATIYELALGSTLPSCGEEWQKIRDGDLVMFRQYSNSLQHLIASMMHPDALQRPLAEEILQHEVVLPFR